MRALLLFSVSVLFLALAARADEPLKVWSFENLEGVKFYAPKDGQASVLVSPDVRTPEGENVLALSLGETRADALPWDIQLQFVYEGGVKAGHRYEVSFLCKGSSPGAFQMVAAQASAPWDTLASGSENFEVSQNWQRVELSFVALKDATGPLAIPRIMLAKYGRPATLYFGPATLKELPAMVPFSLNKQWLLFMRASDPESFVTVPTELSSTNGTIVQSLPVTLNDSVLDIGALSPGFKERDCALLYNEFQSPQKGLMRIGVSADWWLELYVNGEKVYSNLSSGNDSKQFAPTDHVVQFPVNAGSNVLVAKVLSGSGGWRFVCGDMRSDSNDTGLLVIRPGSQWKPIDMDKLTVGAGTILDFSSLVGSRTTAGTDGRLIVSPVGRLAFEKKPDIPVRVYGLNNFILTRLVGWAKSEVEEYAASIARQGYNIVRLQGVDRALMGGPTRSEHPELMKRVQNFADYIKGGEVAFDPDCLDKFDYFLSCLKENGIYFDLDLMTFDYGYTQVAADSVPPEAGFKTQLLFDPVYRAHWTNAVRALFNHYNPYTGLRLKEETALACVEPYNEQEILLFERDRMKVFTAHFVDYLKSKYGTDDELKEAWGDDKDTLAKVPDIDEDMLRRGDARAADAGGFLIKAMSDTTDWYIETIRNIGYPGIITQWDMIMRTMEMPARSKMSVVAQHSYFAHPNGIPTKNLVTKSKNNSYFAWGAGNSDIRVYQGSSVNSSYFRAAAAIRFLDRPFLMTEYSHSAFNRYRHERGLYFGSYSALQGWDGLFCNGYPVSSPTNRDRPFLDFENSIDPISRASEVVTALAWFRGDVKEAPHSVEMDLSSEAMFPKHFLAAIGDDYAKLSMLTKIGIAFPEGGHIGKIAKPDIVLTPTEFAPLSVKTWFATASADDGKIFPSLLDKLRDGGIIGGSNKTDYSERIYQSETGEITSNSKEETMTVIAPRLEGAIVKKDCPVKLGAMRIDFCTEPASVVVASLDHTNSVADAKRLLLVFSTNALNSGMTFENASMVVMVEVGELPVLMKTARLSLKLKTSQKGNPVVHAINMDGSRAEQVSSEFRDGELRLDLDTEKLKYATPFFEIVYP